MPFIFCPFRLAKFGQIMTIKNFVLIIFFGKFFFGVKFVSANIDAFFNKKNGGQIFSPKKDQTGGGGGPGGGLAKDHTFSGFFFRLPSLREFSPAFTKAHYNVADIGSCLSDLTKG